MTAVPRSLWPDDPYTAAVIRKYQPGMLAAIAAWLVSVAARLSGMLAPVLAPPVLALPVSVVVPVRQAVAWSAPAGADFMMTGPPCLAARGTCGAAGRM